MKNRSYHAFLGQKHERRMGGEKTTMIVRLMM